MSADGMTRVEAREWLECLPAGTTIAHPEPQYFVYKKRADGTWISNFGGIIPAHLMTSIALHGYQVVTK